MLRALVVASLLLMPLAGALPSSIPISISLAGPRDVEIGHTATYAGRLIASSAAGEVAISDQRIEIVVDGATAATATTDGQGAFTITLSLALGPHDLFARANVAGILERDSATIATRIYRLPEAPLDVAAAFLSGPEFIDVSWNSAPPTADPPILGYHVYRAPCDCGPTQDRLVWDIPAFAPDTGYSGADDIDLRANTSYHYHIAAYSAEGDGPVANASAATPRGMIDDVEAAFLGFRVCADNAASCIAAGDAGTVHLPGASVASIEGRWTGVVLSDFEGVPATNVSLLQRMSADGTVRESTLNITTDIDGTFHATLPTTLDVPTDACRQLALALQARTPHQLAFGHARLTICG